jgi:hypothetical protein
MLIGKNEMLLLVLAQLINSIDYCIGHWECIPTVLSDSLSCIQSHKAETALDVTGGSKRNSSLCMGKLTVAR